jgi:tetratricopeptide (TPR) repeat protein
MVDANLRMALELLKSASDSGELEMRMRVLKRLGRLEQRARNYGAAISIFAEALDLAERRQDRYEVAGLLGNLGSIYARQADMERAQELTERALRESHEVGDMVGVARQTYNLALIRLRTGQEEPARDLLLESRSIALRAGWRRGIAMCEAALNQLGHGVSPG